MTRKRSRSLTVAIEQHIAKGWTARGIADALLCDVETVAEVWADMDAASSEDLARMETAGIYSARVPEYSSRATPLPEHETEWERRRLAAASRALTTRGKATA